MQKTRVTDKETNIPSPAEKIVTAYLLFSRVYGTAVKWIYICLSSDD